MIFTNIINLIGNTHLARLPFVSAGIFCAKLEYLNPGGSIKDRSALYMIEQAEQSGALQKGGTIIDASSGNHGISVAMIGAHKGYQVIISVTEKISQEKLQAIKAYGAEVIISKPTLFIEDVESYHSKAVALSKTIPNAVMLNQYFSPLNAQAHYTFLAPEIWKQTAGKITHFFAGAGTTGTISGVSRFLKEQNPHIKTIAVDAAHSFYSTKGNPKPYAIDGIGIDFDNPAFARDYIDVVETVTDEQALSMTRTLAQQYGILVGPTSGAVASVALRYAPSLTENDLAVMIFGDSGRAYLSKQIFEPKDKTVNTAAKELHQAPYLISDMA